MSALLGHFVRLLLIHSSQESRAGNQNFTVCKQHGCTTRKMYDNSDPVARERDDTAGFMEEKRTPTIPIFYVKLLLAPEDLAT